LRQLKCKLPATGWPWRSSLLRGQWPLHPWCLRRRYKNIRRTSKMACRH